MSKSAHQPDGYQSVIPYLHVNGAAQLIAFMKEAFDATEIAVYPRPDGTIGHAALRIGDSVVELADVSPEWPAMPCALQSYVPDADAAYHRALKAGATRCWSQPNSSMATELPASAMALATTGYIATQMEVVSREEVDKRLAAMAQHKE
ncbi:MAG TPA: VOC family protein [Candidatus Angelobacter sp.]